MAVKNVISPLGFGGIKWLVTDGLLPNTVPPPVTSPVLEYAKRIFKIGTGNVAPIRAN